MDKHDIDIYIHMTISNDPKYINNKITIDELYNLLNQNYNIYTK